jgi:superfamily II DNA or RNA helicase
VRRCARGLRSSQKEALEKTVEFFRSENRRPGKPAIIVMPTGTGKSGVISCLPYYLSATRALILTPSRQISDQIAKDWSHGKKGLEKSFLVRRGLVSTTNARSVLPPCAVLKESKDLTDSVLKNELLISNAHKFGPRTTQGSKWKTFLEPELYDLIIVDEAHHLPSSTWTIVTNHFKSSRLVFLTATPKRHDGTRISEEVPEDEYVYKYTREQAVADRIIRDVTFEEIKEAEGVDPYSSIVERVMQRLAEKNEQQPLPGGNKHKALIVTANIPACHDVKKACEDIGLLATVFHSPPKKKLTASDQVVEGEGDENEHERKGKSIGKKRRRTAQTGKQHKLTPKEASANKKAFKTGKMDALIIVQRLLEGYDHPPISVLGIATHLVSSVKFQQFVGRGLRIIEGEDGIKADVITHKRYDQRDMFNSYCKEEAAVVHPSIYQDDSDDEDSDGR